MKDLLRKLPKVDIFLLQDKFDGLNQKLLVPLAREQIDALRQEILVGEIDSIDEEKLANDIIEAYEDMLSPSLKPLINATGVILHTNMGRSLVHKEILNRASRVICNYSNLEYNQEKGCRGERYEHLSKHLKSLLGVEDAIVVNNNASAVFLILNTFSKGAEAVVSRGELVEIGGSFRIPEVMSQSGAILREVGATNKTKIGDYVKAINDKTRMLMKVHQSNFTIEGFSEDTDFEQIQQLASEHGLIDYYDLGSGYVVDLPYNLSSSEHPLREILSKSPSLVSFSGDKLFGSVQAGIIVGSKALIGELKKNQLLRMLRVDKVTLSILEETIKAYLEESYELIPTLQMLLTNVGDLSKRASMMGEEIGTHRCEVIESETVMGGGTLPNRKFPSVALHIYGKASQLEREFRKRDIIGRIESDRFLLDFRTIQQSEEASISKAVHEVLG